MHTRCMARSRRAAYYLGTDEQQKRLDQLPWCNWLRFTQKVNQKGKAARFMKAETGISFASREEYSLSERPKTCRRRIRNE
ncbi:MAG: hypothetical protein JM58_17185 [Peptococcaceae bacterium BICA1-8]|nr:MAG: hypothetical protein JM58_17185 [Peptococcaceae bacterium BICA1-8]